MTTDKKTDVRSTEEAISVYDTLKLALEALKGSQYRMNQYGYQAMETTIAANNAAITAIRSVLNEHGEALMSVPDGAQSRSDEEQPAQQLHCDDCGGFDPKCPLAQTAQHQEPVAVYVGETWCGSVVRLYEDLSLETPLYTSPQPSKPLTDEEIWKFWWARPDVPDGEDDSMEAEFVAAVHRILAAHGIMSVPDGKGDA